MSHKSHEIHRMKDLGSETRFPGPRAGPMLHNPAPLSESTGARRGFTPEVLRRIPSETFESWYGAGTDLKLRVSGRGKRCERETMPTKDLTIAMIGSGGDGVVTMGEMLAQAAA